MGVETTSVDPEGTVMSARSHAHRRPRRLRAAVVAVAGVTLIGGGAAFAFWSSTGSGSGAATSSTTSPITVVPTTSPSNVNPGSAPQALAGTFNNPGPGNAYVNTVVASVASVAKSAGVTASCSPGDYTIANPTMTVTSDVTQGAGKGAWGGASLSFNNQNYNQDGCKGATVTITYTAN